MSSLLAKSRVSLPATTLKMCRPAVCHYTGGATRHDNNPEVLEKGKQSVLRKHRKGSTEAPHWHEELASDSEAFVKAQRGEIEVTEETIVKLQNDTTKDGGKKKERSM